MLYMVELEFEHKSREIEWLAWYDAHIDELFSFPGVSSAQQFKCLAPYPSPYLAIYSVPGPEYFDSEGYRQKGGRASSGEWRPLMTNWHRNLHRGLDLVPEVSADQVLLVTEVEPSSPSLKGLSLTWLDNVGLDQTIGRRGIAVSTAASADDIWVRSVGAVRAYKPLRPWRVPTVKRAT